MGVSGAGRFIASVVLVLAAGAAAGCGTEQHGGDARPSTEPGCGLLSSQTLAALTGTGDLQSFSTIPSRKDRLDVAGRCALSERGNGDLKVNIAINDAGSTQEASRMAAGIDRTVDRRACASYTPLQPAGFLCVRDTALSAAIALPKRAISIEISPAPGRTVSSSTMTRAFHQINDRLEAFDAEH